MTIAAPLDDNYIIGAYAANCIFYEVRKAFNQVTGKRRNIKVLRKSQMTKDEIINFPLYIENMKISTQREKGILDIYGFSEDSDRYYIITEARKVEQRVEIQEAILDKGKFSEKNAA